MLLCDGGILANLSNSGQRPSEKAKKVFTLVNFVKSFRKCSGDVTVVCNGDMLVHSDGTSSERVTHVQLVTSHTHYPLHVVF